MLKQFKQLDRLLRGDATQLSALRYGAVVVATRELLTAILVLGLLYGLCMAAYAAVAGADSVLERLTATMIKVPTLFLLTLFITFPTLYAFNALVGSRLTMESVWRLLVSALAVMTAVLASFGPIVAFFSVSTTSYSFMLLLNVAVFAVAGFLGLRFLLRTLQRLDRAVRQQEEESRKSGGTEIDQPSDEEYDRTANYGYSSVDNQTALLEQVRVRIADRRRNGPLERHKDERTDPKVRTIFRIWIVVFGLVGAQLSWVMRPFIGDANQTFLWVSPRESNFFEAVVKAFVQLLR